MRLNPAHPGPGRCQHAQSGPGCHQLTGLLQQIVAGLRGAHELQIVDHDAALTLKLCAQGIPHRWFQTVFHQVPGIQPHGHPDPAVSPRTRCAFTPPALGLLALARPHRRHQNPHRACRDGDHRSGLAEHPRSHMIPPVIRGTAQTSLDASAGTPHGQIQCRPLRTARHRGTWELGWVRLRADRVGTSAGSLALKLQQLAQVQPELLAQLRDGVRRRRLRLVERMADSRAPQSCPQSQLSDAEPHCRASVGQARLQLSKGRPLPSLPLVHTAPCSTRLFNVVHP